MDSTNGKKDNTVNTLRFNEFDYRDAIARIRSEDNLSIAEKLIYQWVKQDKISPRQMSQLLIVAQENRVDILSK